MRSESLGAEVVIDKDSPTFVTWGAPEVNCLAIITDNMTMADAVRNIQTAVKELESLLTAVFPQMILIGLPSNLSPLSKLVSELELRRASPRRFRLPGTTPRLSFVQVVQLQPSG